MIREIFDTIDRNNSNYIEFEEFMEFVLIILQGDPRDKATFLFDLIDQKEPPNMISFNEMTVFYLKILDEFGQSRDPNLLLTENFSGYINGSHEEKEKFLEDLQITLVESITLAHNFFNLMETDIDNPISKEQFLEQFENNRKAMELLNFINPNKKDLKSVKFFGKEKPYVKEIEKLIEEVQISLKLFESDLRVEQVRANNQDEQLWESNERREKEAAPVRRSVLQSFQRSKTEGKDSIKRRSIKMMKFVHSNLELNSDAIRTTSPVSKPAKVEANNPASGIKLASNSDANKLFVKYKKESDTLRKILKNLLKVYTKIKTEEVIEKKLHEPDIQLKDESRTSRKSIRSKKESFQRELKIFDYNFMIATSYIRALNKSLLLLGTNKHQVPSSIDFRLENKISMSTIFKDVYEYFEFFDFAPLVFQRIRFFDGISNEHFIKDIGLKDFSTIFSKSRRDLKHEKSSGKSGSFFFMSTSEKYFIKAIRKDEFKVLQKIIEDYYFHLSNNPNSILSRYYGLHKIFFYKNGKIKKKLYFVIMNNLFHNGFHSVDPEQIFDLKGSLYKRRTSDDKFKANGTGKDQNFLEFIEKQKIQIKIDSLKKESILKNLLKDSLFLARHNLIDYR